MIILTIRTDKPEAEIGLYDGQQQLSYETWQAHRELAETLLGKITGLLEGQGRTLADLQGIVAFQGPGSFTGLRIGLTVANALAYAQSVPVVAAQQDDATGWIERGIGRLLAGESDDVALPEYGGEANISTPRK